MNRINNGNGLPFYLGGSRSRPGAPGGVLAYTKRMSPGKLFILVGFTILSILALHRISSGSDLRSSSAPSNNSDHGKSQGKVFFRTEAETMTPEQLSLVVDHVLATRKSLYSFDDFTEEGLLRTNNDHLLPTTAILLSWKRHVNLRLIIKYLSRYPYIKEIIIWNNNPEAKLSPGDFELDRTVASAPELKVYNSAENVQDVAKYMACSLAKYKHCYIQDDDWLNHHMDALYTSFLSNPQQLHANTLPLINMEHRRWTFTNEDIKMHTGFCWLGTGSFIPRDKAQRMLDQGGSGNLEAQRIRNIDMFFSIWTNQYPYQLSNYLIPLDQSFGWSTQSSVDPWAVLYRNMLEGAGRLYDALSANAEVSEKDYFVRTEELPAMKERYTRSPCHNDQCLFRTSIDPYPNPKEVVFKKDITKIDELNQKFYDLNYPSVAFIQAGAFIHAVDDNPDTCWNSYHAPKVGDHFGLQFVTPTAVKSIVLHSLKVSLKDMSSKISVHVSDRAGSEWTLCRHSLKSTSDHKVQLDVNCRPTGSTSSNGLFHQVKVQFDAELEKAIEVCGIEVGDMVL